MSSPPGRFELWQQPVVPGGPRQPGFWLTLVLDGERLTFELDWRFVAVGAAGEHRARLLPGEPAPLTAGLERHDGGTCQVDGDARQGLRRGKLLLLLQGQRLCGTWSLGREKGRFHGPGRGETPAETWRLVGKPGPDGPGPLRPARPALRLTNLDKPYWPEDGYTKGHLLGYYRAVAPWLLPHLRERPVVLSRYPDGIHGKSFFQHHAPGARSAWLRTVRIETSRRPRDYVLCDDVESLLYLVNLGSIVLHVWPSRADRVTHPDYCVLDLDPHGAPFAQVVEVALAARALCDELGLPSFVKTSGGSGLHVLLPLGGQLDYAGSRLLSELLARTLEAAAPGRVGLALPGPAPVRPGTGARVLVDTQVNSQGRLLVAPLSVRPLPGAPVSMPLAWEELTPSLDAGAFTLATVPARLEARPPGAGADPWPGFDTAWPDLRRALDRLQRRSLR